MTEQQFRSSTALTAGLLEVMSNPTLRQALAVIRESAVIRQPAPPVAGVHPDTTQTHVLHEQIGVLRALAALERMTRDARQDHAAEAEEEFPGAADDFKKFEIPQ